MCLVSRDKHRENYLYQCGMSSYHNGGQNCNATRADYCLVYTAELNYYSRLHDSAPAQRALVTQKTQKYLGYQCLDHTSYSPDLVRSDYHLLSGLKKQLKCRYFSSEAKVIADAETWLDGKFLIFF